MYNEIEILAFVNHYKDLSKRVRDQNPKNKNPIYPKVVSPIKVEIRSSSMSCCA